MDKGVKDVLKGLRVYADPPSSFTIHSRKHFRVSWKMTNDLGDPVRVKVTVPMSPSTNRWCEYHKFQVRQRFRELNITRDVDHV